MSRAICVLLCVLAFGVSGCQQNQPGGGTGIVFTLPAVPVVVSHRDAFFGPGKVAIFSNQTANRLTISATFRNNQKNTTSKLFTIDLEPNGKQEFGWMEGWSFEIGDTITMNRAGFRETVFCLR